MSPLQEVRRVVERLLAGDAEVRGEPTGEDEEADEIILALNQLAERLQYAEVFHKEATQLLSRKSEMLESVVSELDRANAELETFTQAVAHDLKSPLITISLYASMLLSDRSDDPHDKDADSLKRMTAAAADMSRLIEDLISYAAVGRGDTTPQAVVLGRVVEQVVSNLRAMIDDCGARIETATLPTIIGEESGLVQLFQNLIENSIKYRGDQPPVVEIAASPKAGNWHITVKDNCIGIEACHHGEIFEAFKRLDPQRERPGSGIGLATCKKVVDRHGGRIWVESEAGQGATFHVTIPRM